MTINRKPVGREGNGCFLTSVTDPKFKTNNFIIPFIVPLTRENAAENAAVSFMIEDSCKEYPDITAFSRRLASLYGAGVRTNVGYFCDNQTITIAGNAIADRYALNGEEITYDLARLLCGCIFEPVSEDGAFPEKQFALKKQELIDDIDAVINDKRSYSFRQAREIIYRDEPSGIPVKGEKADAAALDSRRVFDAYKRILETARVEICFVGEELPEKCVSLLTEKFDGIRRENVYTPENFPSPVKEKTEYVTERLDVVQSKMIMAFKYGENSVPPEVLTLFVQLFGATPFSMLFKNVREKLSLCYYCSATANREKKAVFVESGVESANIDAAREEILRQLDAVSKGEFPDELLEQTRLYAVCALKGIGDSPRSAADWYFDRCLTDEPLLSPEEYISRIQAVTKEQICALAKCLTLDTVYVLTGKEAQ